MKQLGYLPNERPALGILALCGMQHVLAMFPATVLVALLCGFHVGTVLLAAGLATLVALTLSRRAIGTFIPLFYGSSFSYIAAYLSVAKALGYGEVEFGVPLPDEAISTIQAGIIATGILNILVGFFIKWIGKDHLNRVLPPIVTGPVACVIGFGLAATALDMSSKNWAIAVATLVITVGASHLLRGRGLIGMVPVVIGALAGYVLTLVTVPGAITFAEVASAPVVELPHLTWPSFSHPLLATTVFTIAIMAVATIPESTAHLYQMSIYIDRLADERKMPRTGLDRYIGFNLICDGLGDTICGLLGGPAGTNYGENNSLMAITRNYSGPALFAAGCLCVFLAVVGKVAALVATVPVFVSGGLAIYLFGTIGMQGITLLQSNKVDLFDPLNLAVGATIMIVGIGGNMGYPGGLLPITVPGVFPEGLPAIATAAVAGLLMHGVFRWLRKPDPGLEMASQVPQVSMSSESDKGDSKS